MPHLDDISGWITEKLPALLTEHKVPGAAIGVYANGEVFDFASGVLSHATGVEATADSVFQVGSITKTWTATLVNPVKRIGSQLAEVAAEHHGLSRRQAGQRAVDRLRAVRIPRAEHCARQFPHELSGGMRQRAMIGMAIMGEPALVIADEPTTALDVTVQRQVLRLLQSIQAGTDGGSGDMALLFISHDITVIGQVCDRVLVMYAGKVVENLPTADPADLPAGCAFAARRAFADAKCLDANPESVNAASASGEPG